MYKIVGSKRRPHRQENPYSHTNDYTPPNAFLSVLLCLLAIIFLCIFNVLLIFRSANVAHFIRHTDITGIIGDTDFSYYIVHQFNGLHFHDEELDFNDVEAFIKNEAVSDEIGGVVDGYLKAFAEGDLDYYITTDEVVVIARNLEPEFRELFDHQMTEEDFEYLARTLDDVIDFEGMSVGGIIYDLDIDIDMTIPRLLVTPYLLWGVGLLCALILLTIILLRRKKIDSALLAAGIPVLLAGGIIFAGGIYIAGLPESSGDSLYFLSKVIDGPVLLFNRHGIVTAAAGAIIILISFIFKFIAPKRA